MKTKKTGKATRKRHNPVAMNPLMQRSASHANPEAEKRKERSRIKRDLRKDAQEYKSASGNESNDHDKSSHWQNSLVLYSLTVLPVARSSAAVPGYQKASVA